MVGIISIAITAFVIGGITQNLNNQDSQMVQHLKKLDRVRSYLNQRSVPSSTQEKIIHYYRFMHNWKHDQAGHTDDSSGTFGGLHDALKLEMRVFLDKELFAQSSLLGRITDNECVIELVEELTQQYSLPGEPIAGHKEDRYQLLKVLRRGVVVVNEGVGETPYSNVNAEERCLLEELSRHTDGFVMGEKNMIRRDNDPAPSQRPHILVSETYCDLAVLSRESFLTVMANYPQVFLLVNHAMRQSGMHGWNKIRKLLRFSLIARAFGAKDIDYDKMFLGDDHEGSQMGRRSRSASLVKENTSNSAFFATFPRLAARKGLSMRGSTTRIVKKESGNAQSTQKIMVKRRLRALQRGASKVHLVTIPGSPVTPDKGMRRLNASTGGGGLGSRSSPSGSRSPASAGPGPGSPNTPKGTSKNFRAAKEVVDARRAREAAVKGPGGGRRISPSMLVSNKIAPAPFP